MRSGRTMSDRALRRWAGVVWWVFVVVTVVSSVLTIVADRAENEGSLLSVASFLLLIAAFPFTGMLILRSQPRNAVGWVLLGIGAAWAYGGVTDAYATYGWYVAPGSLPGPSVAAALNQGSWAPAIGLMTTFLILLFPDGRLPTHRWRPTAWVTGATIVTIYVGITLGPSEMTEGPASGQPNPLGLEGSVDVVGPVVTVAVAMLPLCVLACVTGLVLRFRRSHGVERQQLKWLAAAGSVVAVLFLGSVVSGIVTQALGRAEETGAQLVLQNLSLNSFFLIPAAIGTAVLRHRLYDIDVVINRALVYGTLTVSLAGVYLVSVLGLRPALAPLTGESDLAVAVSTLAVAALFGPLRSRIQRTVDRRFYRRRYDAAQTLQSFGHRLRQQVDLPVVTSELRGVVTETMQPEHVTIWLRPGSGGRRNDSRTPVP